MANSVSKEPWKSTPAEALDTALAAAVNQAPEGLDRERVAELFETEHAKLVHVLVAKTRSWPEAREIAAEAFAQILAKDQKKVSFLQAYLYRAAFNIALNRSTRRMHQRELAQANAATEPSTAGPPDAYWMDQQRLQLLKRAIESLSPRCRMALQLRMWEELSYDEIIQRFREQGVSTNERTIRRWVTYAYEHCRNVIRQAEQGS